MLLYMFVDTFLHRYAKSNLLLSCRAAVDERPRLAVGEFTVIAFTFVCFFCSKRPTTPLLS